ncbi:MAG: hypothetical protein QF902_07355 [Rhodospirillales bacterium]|nr:hypothetical protein [Rhodospirillales bacterium]
MKSIARATAMLALMTVIAGCAKPPGYETLELGHRSAFLGNWDELIGASNKALSGANEPSIRVLSFSGLCESRIWKREDDAALDDCNRSIRAKPELYGHAYASRGRLFAIRGQYEWAVEDFDVAIDLGGPRSDPGGNDPRVIAIAGKARVFATSTETEFQDAERSVKFAEKAVSLEKRVQSPAYKIFHRDTLAAAYAAAGRFEDATKELDSALALAAENGWGTINIRGETLATILQRHHQQFTQGTPLRGGIY